MFDFQSLFDLGAAEPAVRPIDLGLSTIEAAGALQSRDHFAFLDTSSAPDTPGCFSVLAYDPYLIFRSKGTRIQVRHEGRWHETQGDPLRLLDDLLRASTAPDLGNPLVPICGGAIGYFAYDLFSLIEKYNGLTAIDDLCLPDCYLSFYDTVLAFDHVAQKWYLAGTGIRRGSDSVQSLLDRRLESLSGIMRNPVHRMNPGRKAGPPNTKPLESNFTKKEYLQAVRKALRHIYDGDIYQVNLSQRFQTTADCSAFELFAHLREINPSQYGGLLLYDGHAVVSSSPELFLLRSGPDIETRPIKGTRPRGRNHEEDERFYRELRNSIKDRAELSMIVDLERNDLGRTCEYGSVKVREHAYIEKLPTVFHTVSIVDGVLNNGISTVDLLRATFPGGSITGCPKIRSIEIIDDLEPTCRNVYTGSIGFIGFNNDLTLNIAIRTIITKARDVYFQVGGGIVADSDPEAEYNETLQKAAAMIRAVESVRQNNGSMNKKTSSG